MKYGTLSLFGMTLLFAGCGTSDSADSDAVTANDVQQELGEAADAVSDLAAQKKDEVVAQFEKQMESLDAELAQLREKGSDLKDDAREQWETQLAELETKRAAVEEKMNNLRDASGEAWEEVKSGFDAAWTDMQESLEDASAAFKS